MPASNRVMRGGSFNNPARHARSSYRNHNAPGIRNDDLGLRPAKEVYWPDRGAEPCACAAPLHRDLQVHLRCRRSRPNRARGRGS